MGEAFGGWGRGVLGCGAGDRALLRVGAGKRPVGFSGPLTLRLPALDRMEDQQGNTGHSEKDAGDRKLQGQSRDRCSDHSGAQRARVLKAFGGPCRRGPSMDLSGRLDDVIQANGLGLGRPRTGMGLSNQLIQETVCVSADPQ